MYTHHTHALQTHTHTHVHILTCNLRQLTYQLANKVRCSSCKRTWPLDKRRRGRYGYLRVCACMLYLCILVWCLWEWCRGYRGLVYGMWRVCRLYLFVYFSHLLTHFYPLQKLYEIENKAAEANIRLSMLLVCVCHFGVFSNFTHCSDHHYHTTLIL